MGNLSYFVHSVSFRGFVFRGFGFVTSVDLINRTKNTNPKNEPLGFVFFSNNQPIGFVFRVCFLKNEQAPLKKTNVIP